MISLEKLDVKPMFIIGRFLLVRWFLDEYYKKEKHHPEMLRDKFLAQLEKGIAPEFEGNLCFVYDLFRVTSRDEAYLFAKNWLNRMMDVYSDNNNYISEYGIGISDMYFLNHRSCFCDFLSGKEKNNCGYKDEMIDNMYFLSFLTGSPVDLSRENIFELIKKKEDMTMYKQQYS